MNTVMHIKWSTRNPQDRSYVPFQKGEAAFSDQALKIDSLEIPYKDIHSAELITRYAFFIPNRVLHLATDQLLVTLGPIQKKDIEKIPFDFQNTKVRSFWSNEFMLINAVILVAVRFL